MNTTAQCVSYMEASFASRRKSIDYNDYMRLNWAVGAKARRTRANDGINRAHSTCTIDTVETQDNKNRNGRRLEATLPAVACASRVRVTNYCKQVVNLMLACAFLVVVLTSFVLVFFMARQRLPLDPNVSWEERMAEQLAGIKESTLQELRGWDALVDANLSIYSKVLEDSRTFSQGTDDELEAKLWHRTSYVVCRSLPNSIEVDQACFYNASETANWTAASWGCRRLGYVLATVDSDKLFNALASIKSSLFWIGLSCEKSQWIWEETQAAGTYSRWLLGHAESCHGPGLAREKCAAMNQSGWNDSPCTHEKPYICMIRDS